MTLPPSEDNCCGVNGGRRRGGDLLRCPSPRKLPGKNAQYSLCFTFKDIDMPAGVEDVDCIGSSSSSL